jgi:hypothetical protein
MCSRLWLNIPATLYYYYCAPPCIHLPFYTQLLYGPVGPIEIVWERKTHMSAKANKGGAR